MSVAPVMTAQCGTCGREDAPVVVLRVPGAPVYQIDDHTTTRKWKGVVINAKCGGTGEIVPESALRPTEERP